MLPREVLAKYLDLTERIGDGLNTPIGRYLNYLAREDKVVTKGDIAPVVARNLRNSRPYLVAENMYPTIYARAEAMSGLTAIGVDIIPPRPCGFAVLERPIQYTELRGRRQFIHALCWGPASDQNSNIGQIVTTFNDVERQADEIAAYILDRTDTLMGCWHGISSYWLARGQRIGPAWIDPSLGEIEKVTAEGDSAYPTLNVRRHILALWELLDETLSTHTVERPQRQLARRLARAKLSTEITVITLRREARPVQNPGTGTPLDHRVWVEQFPRRQWVGSGADRRQEIRLVRGHYRGPEDAPVVDRPKVNRLSR
jgi:hypothetical protein